MKPKLTLEELDSMMFEGGVGFCTACGEQSGFVEPDARRYKCDCCEEYQVYGLEELLMMNELIIE